ERAAQHAAVRADQGVRAGRLAAGHREHGAAGDRRRARRGSGGDDGRWHGAQRLLRRQADRAEHRFAMVGGRGAQLPRTDPLDVYGDVFVRTDLTALLGSESRRDDATAPDPMSAVLQALSSVVVRANVWDLVALSVEGKPQSGKDVRDLASMARGALAVAKE